MSKKYLSKALAIATTLAMLLSTAVLFTVPAAAIDGMFDTHGYLSHEAYDYDGDINSIPGYEYTADGFHMTTADWTTGTPYSHMSTKEKVDLKAGVYMQVRIDSFNYDARDKWVNFNLWSLPAIEVASGDEAFGTGVQTLIRPSNSGFSTVAWYTKSFVSAGSSAMSEEGKKIPADGKNVLTLTVTWNGYTYAVNINGAQAPQKVIDYMNETYAEDSFAYVGFTMYSTSLGGAQEATIINYGTSAKTATRPQGDDCKDAENYVIQYAPIADPNTVPAGQPAIFMNASRQNSDSKRTIKTSNNEWCTEENYRHIVADRSKVELSFSVKNEVSYDIKDFPVVMVMTRNFCTCYDDDCWTFEESSMYVMAGDVLAASDNCKISYVGTACDEPITVGDDNYLYFIADVSEEAKTQDLTGRIHGVRFDAIDVDLTTAGRNEFDVCFVTFFRTEEDAVTYAENYLGIGDYKRGYDEGLIAGNTAGHSAGVKDGENNQYGQSKNTLSPSPNADYYENGYIEGYNGAFLTAYESGYSEGYQNAYNNAYSQGLVAGTDEGYADGFADGYSGKYQDSFYIPGAEGSLATQQGYADGFSEGYITAYDKGYSEGGIALRYYQQGYESGYAGGRNDGYSIGWNDGYASGSNDSYNNGWENGYRQGFEDGVGSVETESGTTSNNEKDYEAGYNSGYNDGWNNGYETGVNDGYDQGFEDGLAATETEFDTTAMVEEYYEKGYNDGFEEGYNKGYNDGEAATDDFDKGYNVGFEEGYDEGYDHGYEDGLADSVEVTIPENSEYQNGYDDGYNDGYKDGKKENSNGNQGNNDNQNNNGNQNNNSAEYDRGYNDGYTDGAADAFSKIGGCSGNISSGALLMIATVLPATYFIFKRKKKD